MGLALSRLLGLKLGAREKGWIVLWVAIVLAVSYFQGIHRPRAARLRDALGQVAALDRQKTLLLASQPDVKRRQEFLTSLKKEIAGAYDQLVGIERDLLDVQDVDTLLESLVKDRSRFEMRLNSIRPVQQKEPSTTELAAFGATAPSGPGGPAQPQPEPYRKLRVQIDSLASFQGLVNYVSFLEQIRTYQEVEGIKVKVEGKDISTPHAVLLVSVLMGETLEAKEARKREVFALLEEVVSREAKDPFLTAEKPKEVAQAVGLRLTGIFSEGGRPVAAMINNEIYRVGDLIEQKRIVAIEPTRVLLEHGNRRFILLPEQGAEGAQ